MRESNFSFPTQNKACVCITSQLYDRRALDTTSPLPLFNSLTHLAYLTSTSPRIREIMTMDGGLERLVRLLHDFCLSPPPPENPSLFYGLAPPTARPLKPAPQLNPPAWDKHATYRFSLAFQCVVNIGVRGSEPIRSRVVQAGTLEVVGCILEAWLDSRGFGGATPAGAVRETREQRHARRMQRQQQDEAVELARALQRQMSHTESASIMSETTAITRDRSGTVVARTVWENPSSNSHNRHNRNETATYASSSTSINVHSPLPSPSPSTGSNSRPDTSDDDGYSSHDVTEADADVDGDIDMSSASASANASDNDGPSASPSPERRPRRATHTHRPSRIVTIVADSPAPNIAVGDNAHIVLSDDMPMGMDGVGVGVGGVGSVGEDGIVSLDANDDLAMGAPPGAPGAITSNPDISLGLDEGSYSASETEREESTSTSSANQVNPIPCVRPTERSRSEEAIATDGMLSPPRPGEAPPDVTPRAGVVGLPTPAMNASSSSTVIPEHLNSNTVSRSGTLRARPIDDLLDRQPSSSSRRGRGDTIVPNPPTLFSDLNRAAAANEIIRPPAPAPPFSGRPSSSHHHSSHHSHPISPYRDEDVLLGLQLLAYLSKYPHVRQAFYKKRDSFHPAAVPPVSAGRGKGKEKDPNSTPETRPNKQTNVFSLVERFTFRSSSTSASGDGFGNGAKLPPEIQYWAGVIMRNACRKDDSRGGIRQCANMLCGRWESYPREFAKCRRCRKAKYCGKECQSTAWSEGHRFWCSAKDGSGDMDDAATAVNGSTGRGGISTESTTPSGVRGDSVTQLTSRDVSATVRRGRDRPDPANHTQPPTHGLLSMLARSRGTNTSNAVNAPGNPILLNRPVQQVRADPAMYAEYLRTAFGVGGSREGSEAGSAGRRRAETVTGATSTGNPRRDLMIPPYIPTQGQVNHRMQGRRAAEPINTELDERTRNEAASAFQRFLSAEGRRREEVDNEMDIE